MELSELTAEIDAAENRIQGISDAIAKHIKTRRLCITDKKHAIRSQWGYDPGRIDFTLNCKKQMVRVIVISQILGPTGFSFYGNNCQRMVFEANYDNVFGKKLQITVINLKAGRGVNSCFRILSQIEDSTELFIDNKFGSAHPLSLSFDENHQTSLAIKYRNKSIIVISSKEGK